MSRYNVTVRTLDASFTYLAIAHTSWVLYDAAVEKYGICSVVVKPA